MVSAVHDDLPPGRSLGGPSWAYARFPLKADDEDTETGGKMGVAGEDSCAPAQVIRGEGRGSEGLADEEGDMVYFGDDARNIQRIVS